MNHENVEITFRGGPPLLVDRAKLARNMRQCQQVAGHLGLRPGQPLGERFTPNDNFSSDVLAAGITIYNEHKKSA